MVFARLDCAPLWRERLDELTLPTLVVHGRADPFFPVGDGEALANATLPHFCSSSTTWAPRFETPRRRGHHRMLAL